MDMLQLERAPTFLVPFLPGNEVVGTGLGYASSLLQLHLGVGLALALLSTAISASPRLAARIGGDWEATLRAAAGASGPVPLLASFALLQVRGGAADAATWLGLLVATPAVLLGALAVLLTPTLGGQVPDVNARTGDVYSAPAPEEEDGEQGSRRLVMFSRVLALFRGIGQGLLVVAALPSGAQLVCASALVRVGLAIHCLGSLGYTLGFSGSRSLSMAREDSERVVGLAPVLAALALIDHATWGAGTLVMMPAQPALYCTLAALAQVSLIFAVRLSLGAGVSEESGKAELDIRFELGDLEATDAGTHLEAMRRVLVAGLYASTAATSGKALVGSFRVSGSLSGFCVEWGEPLVAVASLLAFLLFVVYVAEYILVQMKGPEDSFAILAAEDEEPEVSTKKNGHEAPGTIDHVKAIVAPVHSLVLALIAAHAGLPDTMGVEPMDVLINVVSIPLRYGFTLAAAAVFLQVATLLVFALWHSGAPEPMPEPPFDGTGTLDWEPASALGCQVTSFVRRLTLLLLQGGLFLGWVGLGTIPWVIIFAFVLPLLYFKLSAEACAQLRDVSEILASCLSGQFRCLLSRVELYLMQKRLKSEAQAALKAAKIGAAIEEEEEASKGPKPESKKKAGKDVVMDKKKSSAGSKAAGKKKKN